MVFVEREKQGIMNVYCSKLDIISLTCSMHICVGLVVCMKRGLHERCERNTMGREYIACCFTAMD